ncbi:hypothetical protein D4L85_12130 [Chryseolinea soli]|uniref:Uncharacterized protein n=1 Tax=Chryseolinea soli TaxID=2321403 RepID=A0A385SQS3_9BACT|nr:hypothetical protein D4L85_12130 [Chryseolinea soli]
MLGWREVSYKDHGKSAHPYGVCRGLKFRQMRDFEHQRFLASPGWQKQPDKKQGFGWTNTD